MEEVHHRIYHGTGGRRRLKGFKAGEPAYLVRQSTRSEFEIEKVMIEKFESDFVQTDSGAKFVPSGWDFLAPKDPYSRVVRMLVPTREAAEDKRERLTMILHIIRRAREIPAFSDVPTEDLRTIYKILGGDNEKD